MNAFVLALPLTPQSVSKCLDADRCARLTNQDWRTAGLQGAGFAALCRGAERVIVGPIEAVGGAMVVNRDEILTRLTTLGLAEGVDDRSSDLTLLAALARTGGDDFPSMVCGAFSFVARNERDGWAAGYRDHFGQFPFLYCVRDGWLTCGSDLRAVLHLSGLPIVPDTLRVADFLVGREVDCTRTGFLDLKRLAAACRLTWKEDGTVSAAPYWEMTLPETRPVAGAAEELRHRLGRSVDAYLSRGEAVGAMLSGGLDSSTLVALGALECRRTGAEPLPTLSFTYEGKPFDESSYIGAVNAVHYTRPHLIPVAKPPDLAELESLIETQMDLFLGFGIQKSTQIYAEARNLGLDALIDGHGGDEVISHGYERLTQLAYERCWTKLWAEIKGLARGGGPPPLLQLFVYIAKHGRLPERSLLRRGALRIARELMRNMPSPPYRFESCELLSDPIKAEHAVQMRYALPPSFIAGESGLDAARRSHLETASSAMTERAFEVLHRAAQAADVVPFYPFMDKRVVDFCLSLPPEAKLSGGQSRWILREAMRGLVPDCVRLRPDKADFSDEFVASVRTYLAAHPAPDLRPLAEVVNIAAAERLFMRASTAGDDEVTTWRAVWSLLVLSVWRAKIDQWNELQLRKSLL